MLLHEHTSGFFYLAAGIRIKGNWNLKKMENYTIYFCLVEKKKVSEKIFPCGLNTRHSGQITTIRLEQCVRD